MNCGKNAAKKIISLGLEIPTRKPVRNPPCTGCKPCELVGPCPFQTSRKIWIPSQAIYKQPSSLMPFSQFSLMTNKPFKLK